MFIFIIKNGKLGPFHSHGPGSNPGQGTDYLPRCIAIAKTNKKHHHTPPRKKDASKLNNEISFTY